MISKCKNLKLTDKNKIPPTSPPLLLANSNKVFTTIFENELHILCEFRVTNSNYQSMHLMKSAFKKLTCLKSEKLFG